MALPSYIPTISFAVYDAPVAHTSLNHRPPQVHFFFFSSPFSCVTDFPNPIKRCPAFAPWFYCFSVATGEEGQVFMHLNFCPRIEEQIGRKVPSSLLPACLLELSVHKIFFARSSLVSRPRSPSSTVVCPSVRRPTVSSCLYVTASPFPLCFVVFSLVHVLFPRLPFGANLRERLATLGILSH